MTTVMEFAELIARMTTEEEMDGGMVAEDAISTLNELIVSARRVTGLDPGHERVFCALCFTALGDCTCPKDGSDA